MKLLKLLKIFLTAILFATIPFVVITLVVSKTNLINGISSFVVLTGSMQPTIPTGSIIYTQKQSSYRKGDIVAFRNGNVNVTHRIINVSNINGVNSYQTKGDANNSTDDKQITINEILGKQIISVPYFGRLISFIQTPFGFFYMVLFPMIFFVILELWNLKKEIEKEAEKKFRIKMEFANSHTGQFANKPNL